MAQVSNETEAMVWKRPSFCGKGVTDEEWNILHEVIDSCGLVAARACEHDLRVIGLGSCERKFEIPRMLRVPRFARSEGIGGATPSVASSVVAAPRASTTRRLDERGLVERAIYRTWRR